METIGQDSSAGDHDGDGDGGLADAISIVAVRASGFDEGDQDRRLPGACPGRPTRSRSRTGMTK
jgi:hypothetical protein